MSFRDIVGQAFAVETLKKAVAQNGLSGTYLFLGPEGVGKRLAAKEIAKAVNCDTGKGDSCDQCLSCRKIENGIHPDILWILPKGETQHSIETIRELKREIGFRPWEGRRRIAVLVEAERATEEAQNAFLKMLEETPPGSLVILTAVRSEGVLPTVLSRCKIIRFGPIPDAVIQKYLKTALDLSAENCLTLSRLCHGSLGKALSMKEDFLKQKQETLKHFLERAFHIDEEREAFKNKEELFETLDLLTSWYRDLWVFKEMGARSLLFHGDQLSDLEKEASHWTKERLEKALEALLEAREMLEDHVNPKLLFHLLSRRIRSLQASLP